MEHPSSFVLHAKPAVMRFRFFCLERKQLAHAHWFCVFFAFAIRTFFFFFFLGETPDQISMHDTYMPMWSLLPTAVLSFPSLPRRTEQNAYHLVATRWHIVHPAHVFDGDNVYLVPSAAPHGTSLALVFAKTGPNQPTFFHRRNLKIAQPLIQLIHGHISTNH